MFAPLFESLAGAFRYGAKRAQGAAFLQVAKELYQLDAIAYLCINIPLTARRGHFAHCCYSDAEVESVVGRSMLANDRLYELGVMEGLTDWASLHWHERLGVGTGAALERQRVLVFPLQCRHGETALFGIASSEPEAAWEEKKSEILRETRILADYLHSHVLRINGHNANSEMLISARELDCLKWTAAGKSAWEASVILGISERTVRFHLNAVREKLDCTTTTQAVAKAVSHHLIEL